MPISLVVDAFSQESFVDIIEPGAWYKARRNAQHKVAHILPFVDEPDLVESFLQADVSPDIVPSSPATEGGMVHAKVEKWLG